MDCWPFNMLPFASFVLSLISTAAGAGVIVHTEISHRALEFFDSPRLGGQARRILMEHQDALQVVEVSKD